jgi:WD40 repeat protein
MADPENPDVVVAALASWSRAHQGSLLFVDQFEELFTLNPPEEQARFATVLGRLPLEADVHVVVSMRDDFASSCNVHESLRPIFHELTVLNPLTGTNIRRALVRPAATCGYRFEDDELVEEMLSEVEGERGALPLLAFALAQLWEQRDRGNGVLTRAAYHDLGGVGGALAQHAEATIDRIGAERIPIVRELFRNLVTAEGTRAVCEWDELLSVFDDDSGTQTVGEGFVPAREAAEEVLRKLIDARLLTSYEVREEDREPTRRVEIIHESLLGNWPRLVRWQAQDEEGALLRDQLKQAARLWEEKSRSPDLLWSGTAFREYELWRERYPGKLTALEDDFSRSMVDRARRRRRVRRGAVTAAFLILAGVAAAIAVSRQQTARARDEAQAAALRAEASKLLALAQLRLDEDPTEALAFTTASLELADTREARVFAMRTLWEAPPAFEIAVGRTSVGHHVFSPDGRRLAVAGSMEDVHVWAEDGVRHAPLPGHELPSPGLSNMAQWVTAEFLVTGLGWEFAERAYVWSFPSGERIRTIEFGGPSHWLVGPEHLFAETLEETTDPGREYYLIRSWRLPDGEARELGRVDWTAVGASSGFFEPNGAGYLYTKGRKIYLRPLPVDGRVDRVVSRHESDVWLGGILDNDRLWFREESGAIHVCCSLSDGRPTLTKSLPAPETAPNVIFPERSGRWLVNDIKDESRARLWDLGTWPAARPLVLRRNVSWGMSRTAFHPAGDWVAVSTNNFSNLTFWPLRRAYPTVVEGYAGTIRPVVFTPDSRSVVTSWQWVSDRLRLWPVGEDMQQGPQLLDLPESDVWTDMSFGPSGNFVFVVGLQGGTFVVPLDGAPARPLEGFPDGTSLWTAAISPSGRQLATAPGLSGGEKALRVWDLDSGEQKRFDLPKGSSVPTPDQGATSGRSRSEGIVRGLSFVGESTLYSGGSGGIYRWDLQSGTHELVFAGPSGYEIERMRLDAQGRTALVRRWPITGQTECLPVELVDLAKGTARALPAFGDCVHFSALALDASGTVAATGGQRDGLVRVGRLGEGEPHLLAGHSGSVMDVAISPDLRWVASTGEDNTLRLWPMPDLDEPPLHTLPHDELIAKLKSLTNFRAVRDPEAPNGWKIELGPFPGWKEVPEW